MARLREEIAGAVYHVGARGNRKAAIFRDDDDRRTFLWRLARVAARSNWSCLSYCLMSNHFHLIIVLEDGGLSAGMQQLLGGYSRVFNQRYGLQDHTFKQRFFSERIRRDSQLLEACRYVVLNPVRARLCAEASEWKWSSYRACAGEAFGPDFLAVDRLLAFYADEPAAARRRYRASVASARRRLDVRPRDGSVTN